MNDNTQENQVSDYDSEWNLSDDSPQTSSVDDNEGSQSPDAAHRQTDGAQDAKAEGTSNNSQPNHEDGEAVDVWADATPAQKEAFQRAENERQLEANKAKLNADKLAERGREMKALREETIALQEAARVPTEFESEHETYASDVNAMIERKLEERMPLAEQPVAKTREEHDAEVFSAITSAHPTAGDMYNSAEAQALLAEDPVFKHAGQAMLFSSAMHSEDPTVVVAALDYLKQTNPSASTPAANGLDNMQAPTPRGGKPNMKASNQLSSAEQYDAEWDTDDD